MSELKKSEKMKVVQLDPKTIFDPKNSPIGPQKFKNNPKIKSRLNVRNQVNIENKDCNK